MNVKLNKKSDFLIYIFTFLPGTASFHLLERVDAGKPRRLATSLCGMLRYGPRSIKFWDLISIFCSFNSFLSLDPLISIWKGWGWWFDSMSFLGIDSTTTKIKVNNFQEKLIKVKKKPSWWHIIGPKLERWKFKAASLKVSSEARLSSLVFDILCVIVLSPFVFDLLFMSSLNEFWLQLIYVQWMIQIWQFSDNCNRIYTFLGKLK